MNEVHASSPVSPYLAYFGMTREPFAPGIEDDLFYPEPTRKQRLEILLHLTQYGNELILVTGPLGSGKTTLLQQFRRQAMDNWSIARIEAKGGIDERQLLQQLFHQLHLDFKGASKNDLYENIRHHYDALQHSARQGVIIVDDAEQLNITTLKNILALAALKNAAGKPMLRIILFGTDELKKLFKDAQLGHLAIIPQRVIDLPPFDHEQTTHYVLHRLSAANYSANQPFTGGALNKLYKQSEGWPKRINELAHELLINSLPAKFRQDSNELKLPTSFRPLRLIAIILTIGVITTLLVFQDEINTWINPQESTQVPLALPAQQEAPLAESFKTEQTSASAPEQATPNSDEMVVTETVPAIDAPEQMTLLENQTEPAATIQPEAVETSQSMEVDKRQKPLPENALAQLASAQTVPETSSPVAETSGQLAASTETPDLKTAVPQTSATETPETENPEPDIPESQTLVSASEEPQRPDTRSVTVLPKEITATPQAPVAAAKPPTADASLDLPIQQDKWLLEQNPAHYTLQLVAGNNIETIRRFIRQHHLTDNLTLYHSSRKDKPWYGLVYGIYENKEKATDARNQLPESLRRLKPWIRDLGSIQNSLQQPIN